MPPASARVRKGRLKNTPENIKKWGKLYKDGIIDGAVIMLTKDCFGLKRGYVGLVEIRWDPGVNSPRRAVYFEEDFGVCGLSRMSYERLI